MDRNFYTSAKAVGIISHPLKPSPCSRVILMRDAKASLIKSRKPRKVSAALTSYSFESVSLQALDIGG